MKKMICFTFANISLVCNSPKHFRTMMTISWLFECLLFKDMAIIFSCCGHFLFPSSSNLTEEDQLTCRRHSSGLNQQKFSSTVLFRIWIWFYICSQAATLAQHINRSTISQWQSYHDSFSSSAGRWNENDELLSDSRFALFCNQPPSFDYSFSFIFLSPVE